MVCPGTAGVTCLCSCSYAWFRVRDTWADALTRQVEELRQASAAVLHYGIAHHSTPSVGRARYAPYCTAKQPELRLALILAAGHHVVKSLQACGLNYLHLKFRLHIVTRPRPVGQHPTGTLLRVSERIEGDTVRQPCGSSVPPGLALATQRWPYCILVRAGEWDGAGTGCLVLVST